MSISRPASAGVSSSPYDGESNSSLTIRGALTNRYPAFSGVTRHATPTARPGTADALSPNVRAKRGSAGDCAPPIVPSGATISGGVWRPTIVLSSRTSIQTPSTIGKAVVGCPTGAKMVAGNTNTLIPQEYSRTVEPREEDPSSEGVFMTRAKYKEVVTDQRKSSLLAESENLIQRLVADKMSTEERCAALQELLRETEEHLILERMAHDRSRDAAAKHEVEASTHVQEARQRADFLKQMLAQRDDEFLEKTKMIVLLEEERKRADSEQTQKKLLEYKLKELSAAHEENLAQCNALHIKLRNTGDETAEVNNKLQEAHIELARKEDEIQALMHPDAQMRLRMAQLQEDNRRLLHLLEATKEYKKTTRETYGYDGLSYVPLAEMLVRDGVLSKYYDTLDDRDVPLSSERNFWVPREAVEATVSFVARAFPDEKIEPFMLLLTALNNVYDKHLTKILKAARAQHVKERDTLKRAITNNIPYENVLQESKITHLQRRVKDLARKLHQVTARYDKCTVSNKGKNGSGKRAGGRHLDDWSAFRIDNITDRLHNALPMKSQNNPKTELRAPYY